MIVRSLVLVSSICILAAPLASADPTSPATSAPWFNVGGDPADAGKGKGVAFGDIDNDGDLDLYLGNDGANKLFRNDGNFDFYDITSGPLGNSDAGGGVAFADIDIDGDVDLYIANFASANLLLRNEGGGTFVDVTSVSGPVGDIGNSVGVAFADIDGDGDLDFYLVNVAGADKLYRNEGDGTFADVTGISGDVGDTGLGQGVAFGDYDNDLDLDLYLSRGTQSNILYRKVESADYPPRLRSLLWGRDRYGF